MLFDASVIDVEFLMLEFRRQNIDFKMLFDASANFDENNRFWYIFDASTTGVSHFDVGISTRNIDFSTLFDALQCQGVEIFECRFLKSADLPVLLLNDVFQRFWIGICFCF